jgi:hypothetical protein
MMRLGRRYPRWQTITRAIGFLSLALGAIGAIEGPIPYPPISWLTWLPSFHRNISPEFIGIGVTVLVIDFANEKRAEEREKIELVFQMGSPVNIFARDAVRVLRARGWHEDGTLREADLREADLKEANLHGADLRGALLCRAELSNVDLQNADLRNADLRLADLRYADLLGSNLLGANLRDADLRNADLTRAKVTNDQLRQADSLLGTTMPDGKNTEAML